MFILDDIFKASAKGLYHVFKTIHDQAYDELYDPEKIKQALIHLQLKLEMGAITEEEYDEAEEVLLDRLDQVQ